MACIEVAVQNLALHKSLKTTAAMLHLGLSGLDVLKKWLNACGFKWTFVVSLVCFTEMK